MRSSSRSAVLSLAAALVLGALGCTGASNEGGSGAGAGGAGAGGEPSPCEEVLARCARNQQGCVLDGDTPTCVDCGLHETPDDAGSCAPIAGERRDNLFSTVELAPGEEQSGLCQSWTLNNATELWVNAVELQTGGGYHHSNWLFVPDDEWAQPDGTWSCRAAEYNELTAAVAGGVLYAQSTQSVREVQRFPEGVALRIPPYSRILANTHLLNASAEPLTTDLSMSLYTIPLEEVRVKLTPFRLSYLPLEIQPLASSDFTGACDLDEAHRTLHGTPLAMKLYWVLPHAHTLASGFQLQLLGGPRDGETIFESQNAAGETNGRGYLPPLDLAEAGALGLRFTCSYDNPRDEVVGWGIGDQEMCVMLGFAESTMMADASVLVGETHVQEDGRERFEGHCYVTGFEEQHDKAGGPPR